MNNIIFLISLITILFFKCNLTQSLQKKIDLNYLNSLEGFNLKLYNELSKPEKMLYTEVLNNRNRKLSNEKFHQRAMMYAKYKYSKYLNNSLDIKKMNNGIREYLVKISESEQVESEKISYSAKLSEVYKIYSLASKNVSDTELIEISRYFNPNVRYYFLSNLKISKEIDFKKILEEHINDNDYVKVLEGCIGRELIVGEEFFNNLFFLLTEKEKDEIREILKLTKDKPDWIIKFIK
jgi:hypothetical protein